MFVDDMVANYRAKAPVYRFHLALLDGAAVAYGAMIAAPNGTRMIEDLFTPAIGAAARHRLDDDCAFRSRIARGRLHRHLPRRGGGGRGQVALFLTRIPPGDADTLLGEAGRLSGRP
ncbi:MAG TPA: hypothetical protein VH326_07360 [Sphingomonas sp.]|nr:hypothetical protein [Sphingomonas sp.]